MVLTVLKGVLTYFQDHPTHASCAATLWESDGDSIGVLTKMIEGRCKEKSAEGEVSKLQPWNCEGGPGKLRDIIKSWAYDEEVKELMGVVAKGAHAASYDRC